MLFVKLKGSFISGAIRICVDSHAVNFVVLEFAIIFSSVLVRIDSSALPDILYEIAMICSAIRKSVLTYAIHLVTVKFTCIF
jgi:hypothetical protein